LVPVLVSRALPPSARHHRHTRGGSSSISSSSSSRSSSSRNGGGDGGGGGEAGKGGDEEEAHRAFSDSSMSVTVVTHGPRSAGRAVSVSLFSRTRPISTLDAFPFLLRRRRRRRRGGGGGGRVGRHHRTWDDGFGISVPGKDRG
jgi:hypothetical protein